ncbi:MAG: T9SS type A sorting domain-containing protein [Flavobacteriales bacterium]|nr:T9SS type A sorting domain-containing protein [Flavobacteriales bacterium]
MALRLTTLLLLCLPLLADTQSLSWVAPVDVAPANAGSLRPRIVLNGDGAPVVLWGAMSPMANYVAVGNGSGFGPAIEVSTPGCMPAVADWMGSSIAAAGNTVWVVMKATPEETRPVYVRRSDDGGTTWGDTLRVDPYDGLVSRFPSIDVVDPDAPVVQYMQFDSGYFGARQVVSHRMGGAFMGPVQVSEPFAPGEVCDCCPNQVIAGDDHTLALYRNAGSNVRVIWGASSSDDGMSFQSGAEIDTTGWVLNACPSSGPDGYLAGDSLRYVWMSGANNGNKVYIGNALAADLSLGEQSFIHPGQAQGLQQNFPRIAGNGDTLGVVWQQTFAGQSEILFSWSVSGVNGLSQPDTVNVDLAGSQRTPDIAYANGSFHIVWSEVTGTKVRYRKATIPSAVSINGPGAADAVLAWPNPVADLLQVDSGHWLRATICDLQGRLVVTAPVNGGTIDVSALASGRYLCHLDGRTGRHSFTLVKR